MRILVAFAAKLSTGEAVMWWFSCIEALLGVPGDHIVLQPQVEMFGLQKPSRTIATIIVTYLYLVEMYPFGCF